MLCTIFSFADKYDSHAWIVIRSINACFLNAGTLNYRELPSATWTPCKERAHADHSEKIGENQDLIFSSEVIILMIVSRGTHWHHNIDQSCWHLFGDWLLEVKFGGEIFVCMWELRREDGVPRSTSCCTELWLSSHKFVSFYHHFAGHFCRFLYLCIYVQRSILITHDWRGYEMKVVILGNMEF